MTSVLLLLLLPLLLASTAPASRLLPHRREYTAQLQEQRLRTQLAEETLESLRTGLDAKSRVVHEEQITRGAQSQLVEAAARDGATAGHSRASAASSAGSGVPGSSRITKLDREMAATIRGHYRERISQISALPQRMHNHTRLDTVVVILVVGTAVAVLAHTVLN